MATRSDMLFEIPAAHETHYSNPEAQEWEDEGEYFFKKALQGLAKAAGPLAKKLAPLAARTLVGMIPGVGALAGPLAGKLVGQLVREAEDEVAALEAQLFNPEAAHEAMPEAAHEAMLTEILAAEAAQAESVAEAEVALAAALPITITIMGGRRALRPILPTLAQANGQLVRVLGSQGQTGRQLLRLVPAIQRRTVAAMRALARHGRPINGPIAVRVMAAAANSVLGNPRQVQRALARNAMLRQRGTPPSPRRDGAMHRCSCGAPIR